MTWPQIPVDARTADWPRKVAQAVNRLQNDTALAGGTAAWGSITGTLSAQTDLNSALSGKQATLVSGTNIKTVNGTTLLGSGNLAVGTVTSVAATVPTGFSISGSPITSSGTLGISFSAGYSLPTDANQSNWTTAFGWGDHASAGYLTTAAAAAAYQPLDTQLTDLAGLSYTGNALKVVRVNAGETGFELAAGGGGSSAWGGITGTLSDQTDLQAALDGKANLSGATFSGDISVPDEAYDATTWNGSLEVPTKNAVRDKIETLTPRLVLIETLTPSAVASFDIEGFAGLSGYGKIILEIEYLTVSADSIGVTMQFKLNGGYKTANYKWSRRMIFAPTTTSNGGSASDSNISLFLTGAGGMGSAAGEGGSGTVEIFNAYDTAGQKRLAYRVAWIDDQGTPRQVYADGAGSYSGTDYASALAGVRFATSSGTMSGKVRVYGLTT